MLTAAQRSSKKHRKIETSDTPRKNSVSRNREKRKSPFSRRKPSPSRKSIVTTRLTSMGER